jgi:hypothetical protein
MEAARLTCTLYAPDRDLKLIFAAEEQSESVYTASKWGSFLILLKSLAAPCFASRLHGYLRPSLARLRIVTIRIPRSHATHPPRTPEGPGRSLDRDGQKGDDAVL